MNKTNHRLLVVLGKGHSKNGYAKKCILCKNKKMIPLEFYELLICKSMANVSHVVFVVLGRVV